MPENFEQYAESFDPHFLLFGKLRKDLVKRSEPPSSPHAGSVRPLLHSALSGRKTIAVLVDGVHDLTFLTEDMDCLLALPHEVTQRPGFADSDMLERAEWTTLTLD